MDSQNNGVEGARRGSLKGGEWETSGRRCGMGVRREKWEMEIEK